MAQDQNSIEYKMHVSIPVVVFVIAQIILFIFLAISLPKLFQSDEITDEDPSRIPMATIDNYNSAIPENYSGNEELIEKTLFQLILRNSPDKDISKSVKATVRENSAKTVHFEEQNIDYYSAIIDIPELEQSYWLYSEYSSSKNNKYIDYSKSYRFFCLDDSQEILYPTFDCKDDFGVNGKYELVSDLVQFFDFNNFSPSYSSERNNSEIKLYPHNYDIDVATKDSYIQQTRDAISSLGVSPDLFTYYVVDLQDINYSYPPR